MSFLIFMGFSCFYFFGLVTECTVDHDMGTNMHLLAMKSWNRTNPVLANLDVLFTVFSYANLSFDFLTFFLLFFVSTLVNKY